MILSRWSVILESTDSALYFCKLSKNQREGGVYKLQKSLKCHHHSFNWQNTAIRQIVIPVFFKLQIIIHVIVLPVYKSPELRGTIFNALDIINKLLNYLWLFWNLSLNNFDIKLLICLPLAFWTDILLTIDLPLTFWTLTLTNWFTCDSFEHGRDVGRGQVQGVLVGVIQVVSSRRQVLVLNVVHKQARLHTNYQYISKAPV